MRIKRISAQDIAPVRTFIAEDLKDLVVIAGPNGVGKTRLVNGLLNYFRNPRPGGRRGVYLANPSFVIEATDRTEQETWGGSVLDTSVSENAAKLQATLQQNRRRRNFRNGVLYYESNRSIQNVQPIAFEFDFPDPWEEPVPWDFALSGLTNRWEDTQHAIFKKIENQKTAIANRAIQLRREGHDSMNLTFPDPLEPFRDTFSKLLGPKTFQRADIRKQRLLYTYEGTEYDISTLSSGEQEVLSIAFDFILRNPSHCVVFFDEPELHLHPELLSRLIMTLRSIGESNQFFLVTHSAELISSSLDETIIFLTPPREDRTNQAVKLEPKSEVTEVLHRLGQSVGIVSLGKKIVLIEGSDSSLDKKTYGQIVQDRFPELVLLPSGSKENLTSFHKVASEVLDKTLWGIRFFMLADRDSTPVIQSNQSQTSSFRMLARYHLENYFLDSKILSLCFAETEEQDSWLRSAEQIEECLREIAQGVLGYAVGLVVSKNIRDAVGNVDIMQKGTHQMDVSSLADAFSSGADSERQRVTSALQRDNISKTVEDTYEMFHDLLSKPNGAWKSEFPGKVVLARFCSKACIQESRLKNLYLARSKIETVNPFQDVIKIFQSFADA